jgi:hypothetical protein
MKRFQLGQVLSCFLLILGLSNSQQAFAQGVIQFGGRNATSGREIITYGTGNRNYTFTFNSDAFSIQEGFDQVHGTVLNVTSTSSAAADSLVIRERGGDIFDFRSLEFVPRSSAGFGTVLRFTAFRGASEVARVDIADIASGSLTKYPNPENSAETFSNAFKNVDRVVITIPSGARFNHTFDNVVVDGDYDGDGVSFTQETADGTNGNSGCSFRVSSQTLSLTSQAWRDSDCDSDGISNWLETLGGTLAADADGDGTINMLDIDSDQDGINDSFERNVDTDRDGDADYLYLESDNDGIRH